MGIAWNKSGLIEFDNDGIAADGCLAYFYAGGTTTPIATYSDAAETTPRTHPVVADGNGRWPIVFIPFRASYDVKVVTEGGTQLYYHVSIPNADPVEASEDSVDDAELFLTGDVKFRPSTGTLAGYVRLNARTIGNAASGGSERANADTENLFLYLWNNFANGILAVSTGRGASAAADFAANKTIALFNCRSTGLIGLDDMGATADGNGSTATYVTGDATTGGSIGGKNDHTLTEAQLEQHLHSLAVPTGTIASNDPQHSHPIPYTLTDIPQGTGANVSVVTAIGAGANVPNTSNASTGINPIFTGTGPANTGNTGSNAAHNNVQRSLLGTWYMKL